MKNFTTLIELDEVDSTNLYAKKLLSKKQDTLVVSKRQKSGMGTKGRSFSSEEGGIYLTYLRFYDGLSAENAFSIMQNTAVAVCKTLADFGICACIKWPNDIFVNGKKICGILIENAFRGNQVAHSVIGVGLNVSNTLPEELQEIATTMSAAGKKFDVTAVRSVLVQRLQEKHTQSEYEEYLGFCNRQAVLVFADREETVQIQGVGRSGELLVKDATGNVRAVYSAEVRLKV